MTFVDPSQEVYTILALTAALLFFGISASKISDRLNLPTLLVFLGVGMLAGAEGLGRQAFDDPAEANRLGLLAMCFILFAGGFDTKWKSVRAVWGRGVLLATAGVLLTAGFLAIGIFWLLRWLSPGEHVSFAWCMLLASIISSTDAAAVFSVLRSKNVSLRGDLQPLLELESGSNDPMAAMLTLFMLGLVGVEAAPGRTVEPDAYFGLLPQFMTQMSVGGMWGLGVGAFAVQVFRRIKLEHDGLYYVLGMASAIAAFSGAGLMKGNGFLAVYVCGLYMGNQRFIFHNGVGRFHGGIAWLMQMLLFLILGLLVKPSHLWSIKWEGLLVAVLLMVVARPLAVFCCLFRSRYDMRERLLISWVGLRGGAPIMLATYPLMSGWQFGHHAALVFNIVFFAVLTSVLLQGMTIMPLARLLKLDAPLQDRPLAPLQFEENGNGDSATCEIELAADSAAVHQTLASLKLPKNALVLLIRRAGHFVMPRGDTELLTGDSLMLLGTPEAIREAEALLRQTRAS